MSMLGAVKQVVVGQAVRLMGDPRVAKLMGDPRVMNAAMKVVNAGGSAKAGFDKATRAVAGVFGLATQDEVQNLRSTVQQLEDTITVLQSRGPASSGSRNGG